MFSVKEAKKGLFTVFKNDFFGFRVELNLQPIKAKRKAHKKIIDTLSGLVHAKPFEEFMNYRSRGYRLGRMTVRSGSLCS